MVVSSTNFLSTDRRTYYFCGGFFGEKKSRFYSKMPALREESGLLVTKTAFPLLITTKRFYRHVRRGRTKEKKLVANS